MLAQFTKTWSKLFEFFNIGNIKDWYMTY